MNKKIGPLKTWQWGAIVGGGLGLFLLLRHKAAPVEGPALVGSTNNPLSGAGGGEGGGSIGSAGIPGLIGEPGPVGAPGVAGVAGAAGEGLTQADRASLDRVAEAMNNPPAAKSAQAPKPLAKGATFPLVNPKTGAHYRVEHKNGHIVHVYHSGAQVVLRKLPSKKAKEHHEAKKAATHERRQSYHAPKGEHAAKHAAAVAPRSHARPAPLHVAKPAPIHHTAAPPKPAPRKPAAKRKGRR